MKVKRILTANSLSYKHDVRLSVRPSVTLVDCDHFLHQKVESTHIAQCRHADAGSSCDAEFYGKMWSYNAAAVISASNGSHVALSQRVQSFLYRGRHKYACFIFGFVRTEQ